MMILAMMMVMTIDSGNDDGHDYLCQRNEL